MTAAIRQFEPPALAGEYAEALLDLALAQDLGDQVLEEIAGLAELAVTVPLLAEFLDTPLVRPERKGLVLDAALRGHVSELTCHFLGVLLRNGRGRLLPAVAAAFRQLQNRRQGRLDVTVESAGELPDQQRQQLVDVLRELLGVEPLLDVRTAPELIGGIRLTVGDRVLDGSVRNRLRQLRAYLKTPQRKPSS